MITTFETSMRQRLEALDIDLPHPLWLLIAWLEENDHRHIFPRGGDPVLTIMPKDSTGEIWSTLWFELPDDLVRFWLGREDMDRTLIPILRCGGDGSHMALWRHSGAPDRFVFLGSEGDAFVVAENVLNFIALITMGYTSIEDRSSLAETPEENWARTDDVDWPDAPELHRWVRSTFDVNYPATGASLLPYAQDSDPFDAWVVQVTEG